MKADVFVSYYSNTCEIALMANTHKHIKSEKYVWENVPDDLLVGHGCDIDKQKFSCLQDNVRTTQPITTKLSSHTPLVMLITWLDFGGILLEIIFCQIFFENFGCVFSRSNTLMDISQEWLVRLMWNEKEVHRLDIGWTMWTWPLTWPMTWTPCSFKVKVWNSFIWGTGGGGGGWCWLTWNERDVIRHI